jgi:hypothetical protein
MVKSIQQLENKVRMLEDRLSERWYVSLICKRMLWFI